MEPEALHFLVVCLCVRAYLRPEHKHSPFGLPTNSSFIIFSNFFLWLFFTRVHMCMSYLFVTSFRANKFADGPNSDIIAVSISSELGRHQATVSGNSGLQSRKSMVYTD